MKSETKAAYIKFLELHLAELKENPESTTIQVPCDPNWASTITTTGCVPEYKQGEISNEEWLLKYRIPFADINPADLNLPQDDCFRSDAIHPTEDDAKLFCEKLKEETIETFWEKAQREGLEKMKNFSIELPSNYIERKREFEENELSEKQSTPMNLEPYIGTVIQLTEEQKESLKNSVIPDEVPDSEFILPQGKVKKIVKKKK